MKMKQICIGLIPVVGAERVNFCSFRLSSPEKTGWGHQPSKKARKLFPESRSNRGGFTPMRLGKKSCKPENPTYCFV